MTPEEEAALVEASRRGSSTAFASLVVAHQAAVRSYVAHFVRGWDRIDDLAQETFLGAFRNLHSFRQDAPLRVWLLGVARRQVLAYLRRELQGREGHSRLEAEVTALTIELVQEHADNPRADEMRQNALRLCVDALQDRDAQLFRGFYKDKESVAQLAARTSRSEGAVKVALFRIRQALRSCVERRLNFSNHEGMA